MGLKQKTKRTEKLVVQHDLFDDEQFKQLKAGSVLGDTVRKGRGDYPLFPELAQDIFNSMYKFYPQTVPEDEMNALWRLNKPFVEELHANQDFLALRAKTRLDPVQSAVAAATFSETILKENATTFSELKQWIQSLQKDYKQLQELQAAETQLNKATTNPNIPASQQRTNQANLQLTRQKIQSIKRSLQHAKQSAEQCVQNAASKASVTQGLKQAGDVCDFTGQILGGWGVGSGAFSPISYEERMKVANMLLKQKKLLKIAKLAGRFTRLATRKQKQKTKHAVEEIADIEMGDAIARMIPSEAMLLADIDTEYLFLKRFAEKQLLVYRLEGEESKAKGPMVICFDVSGSMKGENEIWCKAVAIALVQVAQQEKRSAFVIPFDWSVQNTYSFLKSEGPQPSKLLEMASFFSGGGTNFDPPIGESMEAIESEPELKGADIIFITDGAGSFSKRAEFTEMKERSKAHMFTVIIGGEYAYENHPLKAVSDYTWPVDSLTDDTANLLFEAV